MNPETETKICKNCHYFIPYYCETQGCSFQSAHCGHCVQTSSTTEEISSCDRFCEDVVREWENCRKKEEEDVRISIVINKKTYEKLIHIAKQHSRNPQKEIAKMLQLCTHAYEEFNTYI